MTAFDLKSGALVMVAELAQFVSGGDAVYQDRLLSVRRFGSGGQL